MAPKHPGKSKSTASPAWPPKVPMGPIEDVLPLVSEDDDSLDTLMIPSPGLLGEGCEGADFGPDEMKYVCQCLEKNKSVTQLNASMSPIGDAGAAHLARLLEAGKAPLLRISLNGCSIGPEGAKALAKALVHSDVMVLELMNNHISDQGCEALIAAARENKRLKELKVSFNSISERLETELEKLLMR
mmetsp:Transcript_19717/g.37069  ORF Transcript_19717/g.37069 Transcript_19717/m.37069 type:complete len:187 (+) Transcript_19717:33-593(+)